MWIGLKNGQYFLRHVCQDSDELSTYGWTDHNGRDYGRQVLVDHGLLLTTNFITLFVLVVSFSVLLATNIWQYNSIWLTFMENCFLTGQLGNSQSWIQIK